MAFCFLSSRAMPWLSGGDRRGDYPVVLCSCMAKQTITTIFVVERANDGWSVGIGGERLSLFATQRQALHDVKKRRARLTAKGQRSTVFVTRRSSAGGL